jgi:predicted permease
MELHIQEKAGELRDAGLSEFDAQSEARRRFGNLGVKQEESREMWIARYWWDLWQDLRYAERAFRRNPAFVLTAIACLVLGILPNTVLFNVAANALLSPPSVRDPKTLFGVIIGGSNNIPMQEYHFLRDANPVAGLVGMNMGTVNWRDGEKAEPLDAARVTDHFFEITGIPLAMGRPIQSGETDVIVVSDRFWKNHFGGDPNVLGRRMELDGRVYAIAGVLPSNHRTLFPFGMSVDLYLPLPSDNWTVWLYARTPNGMTSQAAADRFRPILQELDRVYPDPDLKWAENNFFYQPDGPGFMKLGQEIGIPVRAYLAMLMIVVGLVLLMACANVSGLLLARASARTEELAIRFSLGAARGRIVRQLLAESLLLVLGATLAGLLITLLLTPVLTKLFEGRLVLQPDWRLLCYSIAMAAVATFVCGIMPALSSSRSGISGALKKGSRHNRWTLRGALVVGQLAVSVVLLCAGLLFLRNLQHASSMNPGFDVDHTVRANMHLIPESYSRPKRRLLIDTALERIRATPGIESASVAVMVPLAGNLISQEDWTTDVNAEAVHIDARFNEVGADYFRTMQIPILQGREFLPSDGVGAPRVVILNQSMARRLFGTSNPVGHVIRRKSGQPFLVAGLARDSKYSSLGEENTNAYYQSYFQVAGSPSTQTTDQSDLHFLIRASGSAGTAVAPANKVLTQLDPSAALDIQPMRENLNSAMTSSQVGASVLGSMGLLGLFLASVGLHGVLLYAVSRRTREIGLRVALGATPGNVLSLVVRESAVLVGGGITIGLGIAVFAVRPLAMFLIADVHPTDATNFVAVAAALCLVAAIATIVPTLRALRADPMTALRHE